VAEVAIAAYARDFSAGTVDRGWDHRLLQPVRRRPSWFGAFPADELADGRDFSASREYLSSTLYDREGNRALAIFVTFQFTHNAQVAILCFALGFAFRVSTALLLAQNGAMAGASLGLLASKGLGSSLGAGC
jgi:uncharacterized membrane protein SpoIIM required for sporulation